MIVELLQEGEKNARKCKELAEILEMNNRDVMEIIRVERLSGEPICSSEKGYFLPKSDTDLQRTISRLYKQARETRKVAESLQKRGGNNV